ncbi:mitochondrial genome maintenance protein MGM101 [Fonsecaea pedrosoi CBS 271.37]|uniref:Mitochondrial genome maintenance protein MGM101 n=1 Tax=Fonsecaea pedrosoi CBS 271.37 TaxID=1442368 RepID=A0A0D2DTQ9_9EURO|nr:mitochondrial genome maintenance protein MGM101 [Fonsecaea pedrosoi CBS 271.37]KIW81191.1 mitochondrial genome maintenance protein MGM101 [Fonsecaea pedrosoi CBS 271.37]
MSPATRIPFKVLSASTSQRLSASSITLCRSLTETSLLPSRSLRTVLPRTIFTQSIARLAGTTPASEQPAKTTSPPQATPTDSKRHSFDNLEDQPLTLQEDDPSKVDWTRSFHGLSVEPFSKEAADALQAPLSPEDIEIKPDGIIYLPEIKYRRILNKAFGPGGWGLAPRSETIVTEKSVTREYALLAHGRLVSIARGEQDYFTKEGIPTAVEGCKSNAMMRCCKDLGVASELWDPRFIRKFKAEYTREVFVEHQVTKRKTKIHLRKGDPVPYPYAELKK